MLYAWIHIYIYPAIPYRTRMIELQFPVEPGRINWDKQQRKKEAKLQLKKVASHIYHHHHIPIRRLEREPQTNHYHQINLTLLVSLSMKQKTNELLV